MHRPVRDPRLVAASFGIIVFVGFTQANAETRNYTYNARGELIASSVSGGPANGVQTTVSYDHAGNRTSYQTTQSTAPIRFPIPITVPINGLSVITIPE